MNPNSANQRWSFWEYRVYPDGTKKPTFHTVKENCARFGRKVFGSATEMNIQAAVDDHGRLYWEIKVRTEGHPVHEGPYTEYVHELWVVFFKNGFGPSCEVQSHARLEAGSRQDGTPSDQLIIMPRLQVDPAVGE